MLHFRIDVGQAVFVQFKIGQHRPFADEVVGRMGVVLEAGSDEFASGAAAAHRGVALDDRDLQARFGEIRGADQAVVSGANDDAIVLRARCHAALPFGCC